MTFTNSDHRRAYIKASRLVIVKPHGKYIHETLHRASEFPRGTQFRVKRIDGHKLIVGYWGPKVRGKHQYFAVNTVLHPVGEKNCHFKKRLDRMGIKLKPGKAEHINGVPSLTHARKKIIIAPLSIIK